jgi:hypothetical protein
MQLCQNSAFLRYNRCIFTTLARVKICGVDLLSDALPFGCLWYGEPNAISNAIGYARFFGRSHDAVIRVYDAAGNVIQTHERKGDFKELGSETKSHHAVKRDGSL